MRVQYETEFRPNFEAYLSGVWAIGGALSVFALTNFSGLGVAPSLMMSSPFALISAYQGTIARGRYLRHAKLEHQERNFYTLTELNEAMKSGSLFMGRGFSWTGVEAQKVQDLYHDPQLISKLRGSRNGATYLHGIGASKEDAIYLLDDESKGHVQIVGTTGAGKTRLMDLLISQAILRDEAVIIIDPKGDHELKNNAEAAYQRMGRGEDFSFFHPAFIDESAAINPLTSFQRQSELASRLASIVPSSESGDVFRSFGQNALMGIFFAVLISGQAPTIMDVQRTLSEGFAPLCIKALRGWASQIGGPELLQKLNSQMSSVKREGRNTDEKQAIAGGDFYHKTVSNDPKAEISEMNNLISLLRHDKDHFKKMVASLVPIIGQLCSGPLATLFSPDPSAGRMPKSGRVISLRNVINESGGVYIGLDTLSDAEVGRAMGQMLMADLASLAGQRYNFGRDRKFVNIFVDEASEVTNEQLIQLLNKGRGAGFRLFVATQTLADYAARSGSVDIATMLTGNMNTTIMLRTVDPDTQEKLSKRLPEVPVQYVMKTSSSSVGDGAVAGAFSASHGERLMHEDKPLISPQLFGELSDLEFFVVTPRGDVMKGRLPILSAPEVPPEVSGAARYASFHSEQDVALRGMGKADRPPVEPEPEGLPRRAHQISDLFSRNMLNIIPGLSEHERTGRAGRVD